MDTPVIKAKKNLRGFCVKIPEILWYKYILLNIRVGPLLDFRQSF